MNTASASHRYHGFAIALHWVLALGLVGLFFMGHYMADLPFSPVSPSWVCLQFD
jgi:cytochrome b561